jgi:hypothetical protein
MTQPNNFGQIYDEFTSDGAIRYEVYSKDTGITYFEGFNDKLDLEGVRRMIRGCIHELTELNSKGQPYSRVKDKNTKTHKAYLVIAKALRENEKLNIRATERF